MYYSISTFRIITSSFKVGSSEIFISLCTKSAVLFAWNKHIKCVKISLIHDNHIIGKWYTIDGINLWFILSISPYQSQSSSSYLQLNKKNYTITPELAHSKWLTNKDERNKRLWYHHITHSSYITVTEDIKLCFPTFSNTNKTVNTTVHNNKKKNTVLTATCFNPPTITNREENLHFSG